ncbi:coronin-2B isoform X2 [Echeneis naucrates]|uniref:coronin-2B isoform X2 n=1 Tax=Echeneis naucrates TaxID=173247 RepID=UPI0011137E1C|nr:coronin-2B-like isoform X2 [Echeneis naucrates]
MSWRSSFRCSKFRHVFGKPANKEHSYDGVPITRSVHDNHYCSANPRFIAVVTECAGGGSFLVLPIHHVRCFSCSLLKISFLKVDLSLLIFCPCLRRDGWILSTLGSAVIAGESWMSNGTRSMITASPRARRTALYAPSCWCDPVKIWDIPNCGVQQNLTRARKTLIGHSRRVGLIEWHPTAENLLLSSAYDYKVLLWDVSQVDAVIRYPARVVLMPVHHRYPSETLLISVSFNSDGSRLAVSSKDRRVRVLDPRTGKILQVSSSKSHRASKVLYIGGLKMLLSTGSSPWNHRQIVLWDPDDLSEPLYEEDLDGSAGVLFPFYDPDTHMLYLAGKGDGNIRFYELSAEKPYIHFLTEFRSLLPQKGLGVMPKRGLDVGACEVFRFYRLIAVKDLVEPLSMIVPRKESGIFQEDLYPMTAGNWAAMTAQEWLSGVNRDPVLMSLKPETEVPNPYPKPPAERGMVRQLSSLRFQMCPAVDAVTGTNQADLDHISISRSPDHQSGSVCLFEAFLEEQLAYQDAKYPRDLSDLSGWQPDETEAPLLMYCCTPHCCEPAERPPPTTESELLQAFYRQQDEIRGLKEQLSQKDVRIARLELDLKNTRNNMRATF